ncbi:hypothetical protein [Saccharophagus degradans]|uniref:hypothetical protein n=1 Tax=Saccharophagus degradans TaxID=86304 RepID=UPI0013054153|nr:hypothetical protein [Saccharophagus degradans]
MNISDGFSLLAVIIAFVSLYRTRKQNEFENALNLANSKLAQLQLEILEREEKKNSSADVGAYFYLDGKSNYRIAVRNNGKATASNVMIEVRVSGEDRSPIIKSDLADKFPVKRLAPEAEIYLYASITLDMKPVFDALISWVNPNGETETKELKLSLPG